ncbi:FxLD family lanthipeptide [Promicromonospora sp. Populi]|uniref:FxLD family lanthipeptide n=1 Tax=Promicromonospora sp. Populi TaxID=3239420 RepID=UPI0034E2F611
MSTTTITTAPIPELDDWSVSFEIVDAPVVVPTACDTSDGCDPTCASSCTSD